MDDFDSNVVDVDEIEGKDIKINSDFYIHNAILKAQGALSDNGVNVKDGFLKYYMLVEHIETLIRAAGMLPEEYKEKVEEFTKGVNVKDDLIKNVRISHYKLELLLKEVFGAKVQNAPLRL